MKRADSILIRRFLSNVRAKYITGLDRSSGPKVLQEIVSALEAIDEGADPDTALQIKRTAGQPPDPLNFALALLIHAQRTAGQKWAVIELNGNKWLASHERDAVGLARMKQIYKQHHEAIQNYEAMAKLARRIDDFSTSKK